MSQDYEQLNDQRAAFLERRMELYQELEKLRREEEEFFRVVHQAYIDNPFTFSSGEVTREVIQGFRRRHRAIFVELDAIRLETRRIVAEMKVSKPTLAPSITVHMREGGNENF